MAENLQLEQLKILLGEEELQQLRASLNGEKGSEDTLLSVFLELAKQKILDRVYPYNPEITEVPARYLIKQVEIAIYLYNKRGAEGQTSHSENTISRHYESADVPESLMRGITPFVGVPK